MWPEKIPIVFQMPLMVPMYTLASMMCVCVCVCGGGGGGGFVSATMGQLCKGTMDAIICCPSNECIKFST